MHHFDYRNKNLHCEHMPLQTIASEINTPVYVYSAATLTRHYQVLEKAMLPRKCLIAFAVKCNSNISILRLLAKLGAGADIVSGVELFRALKAGIPPENIVFSGVGKNRQEILYALQTQTGLFNCESWPEALRISELASASGKIAPLSFRINPRISAGGHNHISTGRTEDKFGIALDEARELYAQAARLSNIKITGIAIHIGSQITDISPMQEAFSQLAELTRLLLQDGHQILNIDLGGGLAIPYASDDKPDTPALYASMIQKVMRDLPQPRIILEPGRLIAGNAGALLTRVEYIKKRHGRTFIILDAGMNDLARPALYNAHHEIWPLKQPETKTTTPCDIVGPICESTDRFALQRYMPPLQSGDILAIMSAGAYGASMASQYNSRPLTPEVMVAQNRFALIRERPEPEHMIAGEHCPDWI